MQSSRRRNATNRKKIERSYEDYVQPTLVFSWIIRLEDVIAELDRQYGGDDDAGKKKEAFMRERGIEGDQGKQYVGEQPRAARGQCGEYQSGDSEKEQYAIEAMEIDAAPFVDHCYIQFLMKDQVNWIDNQPPAIWVE